MGYNYNSMSSQGSYNIAIYKAGYKNLQIGSWHVQCSLRACTIYKLVCKYTKSSGPEEAKKNDAKANSKPCVFRNAPQPQAHTHTFEKGGGAQPMVRDPPPPKKNCTVIILINYIELCFDFTVTIYRGLGPRGL